MKIIKKSIKITLAVLIGLLAVFAVAYNFAQKKIQTKIETLANETINGAVKIQNFNYSLFSTYPKLVIDIESVLLQEKSKEVLKLNNIHIQLDIKKIFSKHYLIDEFIIKNGKINIITHQDSSVNLLNAIKFIKKDSSSSNHNNQLNVELKKVLISDFQVIIMNQLNNQLIVSKLNYLATSIKIKGDTLTSNLDLTYTLDSILIKNKRIVKKQKLSLTSEVNVNLASSKITVSKGLIKLNLLEANIDGFYHKNNKGLVDFKIWAKHTNLSKLAKMDIFKKENIPKIKHGELEINATIKGFTHKENPLIEASASLNSLEIYNRFGKIIDNASFRFKFKSKNPKNIMDSYLMLDSIKVDFASGGYFRGRAEINHFIKPTFKVSWKASEQLENIDKLFKIPKINKIKGKLKTEGSFAGSFETKSKKLLSYKGLLSAKISDADIILATENYPITNINGSLYIINKDIGIKNLMLNANSNNLSIKGTVKNAIPFILNKPTKLTTSLSINSKLLKTETLLAFDTALAKNNKYVIHNFDLSLQTNLTSKALSNYKLIPTGKLNIHNFTALIDGAPPIANFNGQMEANQELVAIKNFKGIIGKSHIEFTISVLNYTDFFQSESEKKVIIKTSLKSEQINVKDFFTINKKFVLPKSYKEEILKEIAINAKIITTNFELQKKDLLPEFELQVTDLQFKTLYAPVVFKKIFVFGMVKNNNVYINSMFGKFGRSDVFMNAQFDNVVATADTISRPLISKISFNSGILDLNELIKLNKKKPAQNIATNQSPEKSNPFADNFPITDFQLNIGELNYYDATIKNVSGHIKIKENNIIQLDHVNLQAGEFGSFEFEGKLDASSRKEAILNSTIKISDVILSKLNVSYMQNEKEVKISDHFKGQVNGNIMAKVPILQDFSFDLERLVGKIKVNVRNGALVNYAPLKELGIFFKNKNLNNVRFDTLKNTMIFNAGNVLLPFMTINTTLGAINLMGYQAIKNNDMEYDIQVPIKLVAGSVLNSLFFLKKGGRKKEDTIKKTKKSKYITVHISSKNEIFKFKLGRKHMLTAPPAFGID